MSKSYTWNSAKGEFLLSFTYIIMQLGEYILSAVCLATSSLAFFVLFIFFPKVATLFSQGFAEFREKIIGFLNEKHPWTLNGMLGSQL